MRILGLARMWGLPWWKENVTEKVPRCITGENDRQTAWNMAKVQRQYDVVCVAGTLNLFYALFLLWHGKKAPVVMGENFLPEPGSKGFSWRLKRTIRRYLFRKIDRFIVYSTGERKLWAEYLGYDESRFTTLLFPSNILDPAVLPEGLYLPDGEYGFAAGRSGRDFKTFFDAVRNVNYRFVVVADAASVAGLGEVPSNVQLYCDIPREEYIALLKNAAFTVLPLHDWLRSTGQVVLLEGYAFGKPTVATRCIGMTDYVVEGKTGFLVEPYNSEAMRLAVEGMIASDENRQQMGEYAWKKTKTDFTPQRYLDQYRQVLEEVIQASHDSS